MNLNSGEESSFVIALRTFLGDFRLPGEAQCIDRFGVFMPFDMVNLFINHDVNFN